MASPLDQQISLGQQPAQPSPYASMSHAQLLMLRNSIPPNDPRQPELAAYEHQAFAREWTQEDPVIAPLSLMFAIPAYAAAKKLGLVHARTPASMDAVADGYKGIGQGMLANFVNNPHPVSISMFGAGL